MAGNTKKKTLRIQENKDKRPRAVAKYVRISPFKVRVVLDLIRGKKVDEAVAILSNASKAGAEPIKKVVESAAANAEHNLGMNRADLAAMPRNYRCCDMPSARAGVTESLRERAISPSCSTLQSRRTLWDRKLIRMV